MKFSFSHKNLKKAEEFFNSIDVEAYERKATNDIRKLEQENRRKLELFDEETKENCEYTKLYEKKMAVHNPQVYS